MSDVDESDASESDASEECRAKLSGSWQTSTSLSGRKWVVIISREAIQ